MNGKRLSAGIATARHKAHQLERRVAEVPASALRETLEELWNLFEGLEAVSNQNSAADPELLEFQQAEETAARGYHELFEISSLACLVTDPQGVIQDANATAAALLGMRPEALIGIPIGFLIAEPDREVLAANLAALHRTTDSRARSLEARLLRPPRALTQVTLTVAASRGSAGRPTELHWLLIDVTGQKRTEEALRVAEEKFKTIFEGSLDAVAIIRVADGTFADMNAECSRFTGMARAEMIGRTPAELGIWVNKDELAMVLSELRSRGFVRNLETSFRRKDRSVRRGLFSAARIEIAAEQWHLVTIRDITEHKAAEETVQELSGRLLRLQDEERRRIARELHDTTAQKLAALSMNLSLVERSDPPLSPGAQAAFEESLRLAEGCLREIRTLSYLLHPPMLDEAGLAYALRGYVEGFTRRSGIRVELDLPGGVGRLPDEMETTLFRIVQESLTNVHLHSGSPTARIALLLPEREVVLEISDQGRGFPAIGTNGNGLIAAGLGVGIRSMQERARQAGGRLEIHSAGSGATVRALLPRPANDK
ncbi:MAG TPA: PAS domain S-box protein [Candidatus Binataceae bacterium]|nr:PAS domain S-box protein [Candidatus Binataceae bacterium]